MSIRSIKIKNFRGIKSLEWKALDDFGCLIGPGDSGKTTILDAIQFCFWPSWYLSFDDSDFFGGQRTEPILIEATLINVPRSLMHFEKFGHLKRGWNSNTQELVDEPADQLQEALTIRLTVDESLEPKWMVVTDRGEEKSISAKERMLIGVFRVGENTDRELAWGRGSALSQLVGSNGEIKNYLNELNREIRRAGPTHIPDDVKAAATKVEQIAREFAVIPSATFTAALDSKSMSLNAGLVGLHDGDIPLRLSGTGSRRLTALSAQLTRTEAGAIILIDEIETGLEPYRIRQLIEVLRSKIGQNTQVLVTTHSSVAIAHIGSQSIWHISRGTDEQVPNKIDSGLQSTVRRAPEAFFARKIVVCEGKTELGLAHGLASGWTLHEHRDALGIMGTVPINGNGGTTFFKIARDLKSLGKLVCILFDGDKYKENHKEVLACKRLGIEICRWKNCNTETALFRDLQWQQLKQVIEILFAKWDANYSNSQLDVINKEFIQSNSMLPSNIDQWATLIGEDNLRTGLAVLANKQSWFKNDFEIIYEVGRHVTASPLDPTTDLCQTIAQLKSFYYGI